MTGERSTQKNCGRGGYTLIEVIVSSALGTVVMIGILSVFVWSLRTGSECRQFAWVQSSAVSSSQRIVSTMRSAMGIHAIDISGDWVEMSMPPTGRVSRFWYEHAGVVEPQGRLLYVSDVNAAGSETNILAHGVTKVMTLPVRNVFERTGTNTLRIAYRITRPMGDDDFPAEVDVGVRLRNQAK